MASVLSVNIGAATRQVATKLPTGIAKVPVAQIDVFDPGPKRRGADGVGYSGVKGDFIGNGRHHGGADRRSTRWLARNSITGRTNWAGSCPTGCSEKI